MKRLVKNNFIYYFNSGAKVLLSIVFVFSFTGLIFVYDTLELNMIKGEANIIRLQSYTLNSLCYSYLVSHDIENIYNEHGELVSDDEELNNKCQRLNEVGFELGDVLSSYATLHAGGRMNVELTPHRLEINRLELELYDLAGEDFANSVLGVSNYDNAYEYKLVDQERLEKLIYTLTPDYFNKYTITLANYPSKVFEGLSLFVIFIFLLLLFHDLFSKDFETDTYRHLYSLPFTRKKIILSKIIFSFIYTLGLIFLGIILGSIYLLFATRIGYNVVRLRHGYLLHPIIININPFTIFGASPKYAIISTLFNNVVTFVTGFSLIGLWLLIINTLSFKLKSSSSVLTTLTFVLMTIFFIDQIQFTNLFAFFIPLFGFNFSEILINPKNINVLYLVLISVIVGYFLLKLLIHGIVDSDFLGSGEHND